MTSARTLFLSFQLAKVCGPSRPRAAIGKRSLDGRYCAWEPRGRVDEGLDEGWSYLQRSSPKGLVVFFFAPRRINRVTAGLTKFGRDSCNESDLTDHVWDLAELLA